MCNQKLIIIVGTTISGYCLRWWRLHDQPDGWKLFVLLILWWIKGRWKSHGLNKPLGGLYTHHDMLLYPVRHKICVSCCLLNAVIMLAIKIGNASWQFSENVSGGNICMLLDCKAFSSNFVVYKCAKPIWQGFFLVSLSRSYWIPLGNSWYMD